MGCIFSRTEDEEAAYDMSSVVKHAVVFVMGVPGAGNDTVAESIADITEYTMIKPGELIRCEAAQDTTRGRMVADKLNNLEDIPEQTTIDLIKEAMLLQQHSKGYIIVGFPKNARLAAMFTKQVKRPEKIVALKVDNEVAACRLQSKLSELGRPASEINAARSVVRIAANRVRRIHKRYGPHVVTLDNNENQKALAAKLKEVLSEIMQKHQEMTITPTAARSEPQSSKRSVSQSIPLESNSTNSNQNATNKSISQSNSLSILQSIPPSEDSNSSQVTQSIKKSVLLNISQSPNTPPVLESYSHSNPTSDSLANVKSTPPSTKSSVTESNQEELLLSTCGSTTFVLGSASPESNVNQQLPPTFSIPPPTPSVLESKLPVSKSILPSTSEIIDDLQYNPTINPLPVLQSMLKSKLTSSSSVPTELLINLDSDSTENIDQNQTNC